ncbi:hypothetical protein ES703_78792 [subsurface metagenome]
MRCATSVSRAQPQTRALSLVSRLRIIAKIDSEESPVKRRLKYPASCLSLSEARSTAFSLAVLIATTNPIIRIATRTAARSHSGHSY